MKRPNLTPFSPAAVAFHALVAALLALASCSSSSGSSLGGPTPLTYDPAAQPPSILRDVAMVNDDVDWNAPFIPGLRTTMDGRVALKVQGGPSTLSFYLFAPEAVNEPILTGPIGARLLASTTPVVVTLPPAAQPGLLRVGHHTICDPTEEFPVAGERPNPYPCGADLANDCYDFTVISSLSQPSFTLQMWGTPVTVEVASPKTASANIVRVELGTSVEGAVISNSPELAEVAVTVDGRLLTGRLGGAARYWTNPNTGVRIIRPYDLVYSMLPEGADPYVGLFVDPRTTEGATRALLSFPDGTSVRLVDRQTLQYVVNERVQHEVELPPHPTGFIHLGWHVRRAQRELTLLVDGFPFDRFEASRAFFGVEEGVLTLGRGPDRRSSERDAGVRGWVDDFKVLAHAVDPEVACNHAGGTLVQLLGDALGSQAGLYPEWAHAEVAAAANRPLDARYACFHDYSADNAATLANIPAGTESLRNAILFPEGPLRAGVPRPDSSANAFCLSCHSAAGIGSMGLAALEARPGVLLENDPRRQPHQPPRRVFGNIPAGWIPPGEGPGSPMGATRAPPEGVLIDQWVLPR